MNNNVLGAIITVLVIASLSFVITIAGGNILPSHEIRGLAEAYLKYSYNPWHPDFTAYSPEAVTSIVWDFRGLDTVFETAVFYLAIIGSIALARGYKVYFKPDELDLEKYGLSLIVKNVTRISAPLILVVAASIALHGHLTPGGGFQGGSTAAVAPLLVLIVFSQYFLLSRGIKKESMLLLRSIGLTGIGLTAISVYLYAVASGSWGYVLQNQPKIGAPVGMPTHILGQLISGSLWFFNIFEFFAVMAGFTIVFLLLTIPEKAYRGEEK